jgi:hypothetical protein
MMMNGTSYLMDNLMNIELTSEQKHEMTIIHLERNKIVQFDELYSKHCRILQKLVLTNLTNSLSMITDGIAVK